MLCSWAWSQRFPEAAEIVLILQQTQCWAWLEAVQGVLLNRAWPEERILWVEWMFSWWLLEETPQISQSSSEVHWAEDFIWWLCFPVTLLLGAEEVIFSLSTKGILERKYEAESNTKLRYSWWGILETVYRFLLPLTSVSFSSFFSPFCAEDGTQGRYTQGKDSLHHVIAFSEATTFSECCAAAHPNEKDSAFCGMSHATVWAPERPW